MLVLLTPLPCISSDSAHLVVTGNLKGAVKECVCPHGQPGGLARRKTIFDRIRQEQPESVFVDCGKLLGKEPDSSGVDKIIRLYKRLSYDLLSHHLDDYRAIVKLGFTKQLIELPVMFDIPYDCLIDLDDTAIRLNDYFTRGLVDKNSGNARMLSSAGWEMLFYTYRGSHDSNDNAGEFPGLIGIIYNLSIDEDNVGVEFFTNPDSSGFIPGVDVVIIGGGGYIESEVIEENDVLVIYPGVYGEFVLQIDIRSETGTEVSGFEWVVTPTESVIPDSTFNSIIEKNSE